MQIPNFSQRTAAPPAEAFFTGPTSETIDTDDDVYVESPPVTPEFAPIAHLPHARLDYPRLDLERSDSLSTLASFRSTEEAAALAMGVSDDILSSQGNPIRDCAFSFYLAQLKRALTYQPPCVPNTPANRTLWRQNCATIGPDFFWARQDPTMADSPEVSAQAVECLIDNHLLHRRSSHDVPISEAWVRDYVTQEAVRAAKTTSSSVRKLFAPPFLVFTVVGLNMAKDAGEFDFFELKEIYGFRALTRMALPNPFGIEPPQTTQEACQERACNRTVTPQMIQSRLQRVAERKHEMQSLIQAFEIQEMRRRANNFF